jgi:hypothetical protein
MAVMRPTVEGHGLAPALQDYPQDAPAARVDGQMFTVGDLTTLLGIRSARFRPATSLTYGVEDLLQQALHAPVYKRLSEEAQYSGLSISPSMREEIEADTRAYARRFLYRREVEDKLAPPTLEQLKALYEDVKDTDLATPERFLVRRITIPFDNGQQASEATARLESIRTAYNEGADIMALLREAQINAPTRVFYPDQEPDAPFIDSLREVPNDHALPVRQADDSVELLIRHLHIPPGSVPFESSISFLNGVIIQQQSTARVREYFRQLTAGEGILRLVGENMQSRGELALDSDVILLVDDQPVHRRDLRSAIGWDMDTSTIGDSDVFMTRILSSGLVQDLLLDTVIERENLLVHATIRTYRNDLSDTILSRAYLAETISEQISAVINEEALTQWRNKEAALGCFHGRVRFDMITFQANATGLEQWMARFREAATPAQFNLVARDAMRERAATTMMSGLQDYIGAMPAAFHQATEGAALPTIVIPPADDQDVITVYCITEAIPDRQPDDEALEQARREVYDERWQDAFEALLTSKATNIAIEPLISTSY